MKRFVALAVASAFVVTPSLSRSDASSTRDCALPVFVAGQGPSCRVGNLWRLRLADGSTMYTHGPDPAAGFDNGYVFPAPPIAPVCTRNLSGLGADYYGRVIYAHPADTADSYARLAPYIRDAVSLANGKLHTEAARFQVRRDYRMACDAGGSVLIDDIVLPTASASASFSTIVNDLKALGYTNSHAKYWVWYDGAAANCPCLGQGQIYSDDRLAVDNASNNGGSVAVVYGAYADYSLYGPVAGETVGLFEGVTAFAFMHETGHTMGAVQLSAPHSTGGWHCTDGYDIMCYNDGGSKGSQYGLEPTCPIDVFDCGNDDYFNPGTPSGYLATHWNVGSKLNRFLYPGALP